MKNFFRKEKNTVAKSEQQVPISVEQENNDGGGGGSGGGGFSKNNYTFNPVNKPVTDSPTRQNLTSTLNNNPQQQYYDVRSSQPIYVPPFLINNTLPRSHRNHKGPSDYLAWSVANIFICVIVAVPALFFSIQTRDMKRAGNVKKAKVNSRRSLILNIIASIVGLLTILLAVILRFALYHLFVHNDVNSQNVPLIAGG